MNAPHDPKSFVPEYRSEYRVVGTRPVRPDGIDKVTGKAIYGTDHIAANMLFAATLRSPHPHARIKSIDTKKAEALTGVKAIVTGRDFPLLAAGGDGRADMRHIAQNCMALEKVLYAGHAVAAVAATSQLVAEAALALIDVEYEVLPHAIDLADAMAPDAPVLHDDMFTKGLAEKPGKPSNIALRFQIGSGDVDAAFSDPAAVTVSGRYSSQPVHQGYIEPHAAVASWNTDEQAQIWCSSQGQFDVRDLTASVLNISATNIRVMPLEIGGGFGGKTTIYLEPVAMLLSRKAGRPVRIAMSRAEVFLATGPAPGSEIEIRRMAP
jgi:CO/xanthine dehydrogenase Mo-binding subunit